MNEFLLEQFPALTTDQLAQIDEHFPRGLQFQGAGEYWRSAADAYGDMRYMCSGLYISNAYAFSLQPAWNYHYNVIDPPAEAAGFGVEHTVEVNAIWAPAYVGGGAPASYSTLNKNAIPLMQGYWTSFIRTYNPNIYRETGTPFWGQWIPGFETRIRLETNTTAMEIVDLETRVRCSYLSGIGPSIQQ
jgi:carboxylesterase type B